MLLTEPLLSCPCCVFGVIVTLEDPATTHLQCSYWGKEVFGQNLAIHPSSPQYGAVVLSPLQQSTPKAWCFHPHASRLGWCSWDCTHPSSNTARGVYIKKFYFSLWNWPHDLLPCLLWIIQMVFGNLQTGLDMCWLEQGIWIMTV